MKKFDFLIIGVVLLLAIILVPIFRNVDFVGKTQLVVYIDGEIFDTYDINEPQTIEIVQDDGKTNVIVIDENGEVYMESASCPKHECIDQGHMSLDNIEKRSMLNYIICLPNKVSLELRG